MRTVFIAFIVPSPADWFCHFVSRPPATPRFNMHYEGPYYFRPRDFAEVKQFMPPFDNPSLGPSGALVNVAFYPGAKEVGWFFDVEYILEVRSFDTFQKDPVPTRDTVSGQQGCNREKTGKRTR
jgi:hypothetical protein